MPLKPHPTDPDKMVYVSRQYDLPDATMQSLKDLNRTVCDEVGKAAFAQPAQPQQEPVAGMVLVPYEPCFAMQEQGSMASDYDLSQSRAKRVYQAMIDMHQVLEEKELSDEWLQLNAGYTTPPQRKPLTDEEIMELLMPVRIFGDGYYLRIARAIEAKLKE